MKKITPLGDRVLIEALSEEERAQKTKYGIVIPDTAEKEKPLEGKVAAVGEGRTLDNGKVIKPSVKKGDRVLYAKYGPTEIKVDGKEYVIAREEDVLAVIS